MSATQHLVADHMPLFDMVDLVAIAVDTAIAYFVII